MTSLQCLPHHPMTSARTEGGRIAPARGGGSGADRDCVPVWFGIENRLEKTTGASQ